MHNLFYFTKRSFKTDSIKSIEKRANYAISDRIIKNEHPMINLAIANRQIKNPSMHQIINRIYVQRIMSESVQQARARYLNVMNTYFQQSINLIFPQKNSYAWK